jgi:hypothetical protein
MAGLGDYADNFEASKMDGELTMECEPEDLIGLLGVAEADATAIIEAILAVDDAVENVA